MSTLTANRESHDRLDNELRELRANFETSGYATVDLNGDRPGFTSRC